MLHENNTSKVPNLQETQENSNKGSANDLQRSCSSKKERNYSYHDLYAAIDKINRKEFSANAVKAGLFMVIDADQHLALIDDKVPAYTLSDLSVLTDIEGQLLEEALAELQEYCFVDRVITPKNYYYFLTPDGLPRHKQYTPPYKTIR